MNYKKIGKLLKKLRKKNKYTQEQLAKKINISHQAISRWEKGLGLPDYETLIKLTIIYDISEDEILNGKIINNSTLYKLFNTNKKSKSILRNILILGISILYILSLIYMLFNYNKIKIYKFTSNNTDNVYVGEGYIMLTPNKTYYYLPKVYDNKNELLNPNKEIKSIKYYYTINNKKIYLTENTKNIKNNICVEVIYNEKEYDICGDLNIIFNNN